MHDKALGIAPLIRERLLDRLGEEGNASLKEELLRSAGERASHEGGPVPLEHLGLQRDVLTPLRREACIPEHFVGAGTAKGGVDYARMPSMCRHVFGKKVFRRLDEENYDRFLVDAAKSTLLGRLKMRAEGKVARVNVAPSRRTT
ncbi:hypothetical protein ACHAWF_007547 [Thalassiosira exigua]